MTFSEVLIFLVWTNLFNIVFIYYRLYKTVKLLKLFKINFYLMYVKSMTSNLLTNVPSIIKLEN